MLTIDDANQVRTSMMQQATLNLGGGKEVAARAGPDTRADGGRRMVLIERRRVTIRRRVRGVKMHLSLPIENYLGVAIGREQRRDGAFLPHQPRASRSRVLRAPQRGARPCRHARRAAPFRRLLRHAAAFRRLRAACRGWRAPAPRGAAGALRKTPPPRLGLAPASSFSRRAGDHRP